MTKTKVFYSMGPNKLRRKQTSFFSCSQGHLPPAPPAAFSKYSRFLFGEAEVKINPAQPPILSSCQAKGLSP